MSEPISVFISYSHEDKWLARQLAQAMTPYGLRVRVWIDEGELMAGDSIIERVSWAIAEVNFVVALVSYASIRSSWCQKELALAITGGLQKRAVKVLPLRVAWAPMPDSLADTFYLELDEEDLTEVVGKLVLAVMRHATISTLGENLASSKSAPPQPHRSGVPVLLNADSTRHLPDPLEAL